MGAGPTTSRPGCSIPGGVRGGRSASALRNFVAFHHDRPIFLLEDLQRLIDQICQQRQFIQRNPEQILLPSQIHDVDRVQADKPRVDRLLRVVAPPACRDRHPGNQPSCALPACSRVRPPAAPVSNPWCPTTPDHARNSIRHALQPPQARRVPARGTRRSTACNSCSCWPHDPRR